MARLELVLGLSVDQFRFGGVERKVLYQARLGVLAHEEGQKLHRQIHEAGEVGGDLGVESGQVNFRWLCEVDLALNSGVQEDAVQLGVSVCDAIVDGCKNIGVIVA